jgi:methyl-accepting chemotaxis protein
LLSEADRRNDTAGAMVWAAIAAATVLVAAAAFAVTRSITLPLGDLRHVMRRLADNDLSVTVAGTERGDEIGEMAGAVQVFKDNTAARQALEAEQQSEERQRTLRVRAALDSANAAVMIVGADRTVAYLNQSATQLLRRAQDDLRAAMPGLNVDRLIGADVGTAFAPAQGGDDTIRRALTAMRGVSERVQVGATTFHLDGAPIVDDTGARVGISVEWQDITQEVAVEREIEGMVNAIAAGDLSQEIEVNDKSGFTRQLSDSINHINRVVREVTEDFAAALSALAQGNLTHRITKEYSGTFDQIKSDANQTLERLNAVVADISRSANDISNAANEIAAGSQDLANRTEQQASSLEQTSGSMEEMTSTVRQNAENAQQANEQAESTRKVAQNGVTVVETAVSSMGEIETASEKVADIIGVIDDIAFQTNLLALNAAVEAARAGEAGKGFAVVAKEVRTLAQRSSEAARDIKALIKDSNDQIKTGVDQVNRAGSTFREITGSVQKVADYVADIARASAEQANGIEEIKVSVNQMDEMTQKNSALVEESSASARALQDEAEGLTRLISYFRTSAGANRAAAQGGAAAQGAGPRGSGGRGSQASQPTVPRTNTAPRLRAVEGSGGRAGQAGATGGAPASTGTRTPGSRTADATGDKPRGGERRGGAETVHPASASRNAGMGAQPARAGSTAKATTTADALSSDDGWEEF